MAQPFAIRFSNDSTAEPLRGVFSDDDWRLLTQFLDDTARLRRAEYVRTRADRKLIIEFHAERGLELSGLPEQRDLAELLHTLRPFVLEDERANFMKALNVLGRREPDPRVRDYLKQMREVFVGEPMRAQFRFFILKDLPESGDVFETLKTAVALNSDRMLKLWLNGFEYHRDEAKRHELEDLCGAVPLELAKAAFVLSLNCKVNAVLEFANTIAKITAPA